MKARTIDDVINDKSHAEIQLMYKDFIVDLFRTLTVDIEEFIAANLSGYLKSEDFVEELSIAVRSKLAEIDSIAYKDSCSIATDSIIIPKKHRRYKELRALILDCLPLLRERLSNREATRNGIVKIVAATIEATEEEGQLTNNKRYTRLEYRLISVIEDCKWQENPFEWVRRGVYKLKEEVLAGT